MSLSATSATRAGSELPGRFRMRGEVASPAAYAIVDCETTGTNPAVDEIVSLAVVRIDADGIELARLATLIRPSCPIPPGASAVHGIHEAHLVAAPRFAEIASGLLDLLAGAVFVAHNASFDLAFLQRAFARVGFDYRPAGVACTLEAFRLLEPLAPDHRLESICRRHGIVLENAHDAVADVLATTALLRLLLGETDIAPETVELDLAAYLRLRSRGDRRRASARQIRRIFELARPAGLLADDGTTVDRDSVVALVHHVIGSSDLEALTREQVQDVYDELERRIAVAAHPRAA